MKKLIFAFLIFALTAGIAFAEDDIYPYLDADIYFQAFLVHQTNFTPSSGIFGSSMGADTGNFNSDLDADYDQLAESRFRLFLTGNMTEHVKGKFTLEVNPEYGHEQGFGDFRINNGNSGTGELRIKHFFIEVNHPLAGTLGYRVGRQGFGTPQSLIVGDPDAEGITLWYKNKKAGKFTVAGAVVDTQENREIEDIYGHFRYDLPAVTPWFGMSLYGSTLVVRDLTAGAMNQAPEINRGGGSRIGDFLLGPSGIEYASGAHANLYWAGLQAKKLSGNFNMELNAVMSTGSIESEQVFDPETGDLLFESDLEQVLGYMAMLEGTYGRSWYRFGLAGAFVSGHDPDPESDLYTGYIDVNACFTFTRFFFCGSPYLVSSGFASPSVQGSGLMAAKLYWYTTPTYWLSINTQVAALSAAEDRPQMSTDPATYESAAEKAGRYYGTEFDLWMVFTPAARINWLVEFDYFHPGDYFAGTGTEDDPGNGFLESPDPAYRAAVGFMFK